MSMAFPAELIVTDFSWALIHSSLQGLNHAMNLEEAVDTVRLIFKVFGSQCLSKPVRKATMALLQKIKAWKIRTKCESALDSVDGKWAIHMQKENEPYLKNAKTSIRKRSPWMETFMAEFQDSIENADGAG